MSMEAIILAGGFGTRLSHIVKDIPKPMAKVNGVPFLEYILHDITNKGIDKIIIAVGYKKEIIIDYFGDSFKDIPVVYSIEDKPLFTGGAIKKALTNCKEKDVFVINGDTFFDIDYIKMKNYHINNNSKFTIATKHMLNYDRYGSIILDDNNRIVDFVEKKKMPEGIINGGIYLIKNNILDNIEVDKFSFEKDFMEKSVNKLDIYSFNSDTYFIDIGIEEDYYKVQDDIIFKMVNFDE